MGENGFHISNNKHEVSEDLEKELAHCNSVENLTDQKLLFKIAKTDKNILIRQSAIRALKDQTLLEEILEEIIKANDDCSLISTVVCNPNFANQELLENIIVTTKDWCTCMFAIQNPNFRDQKLLAEIALNIEFFPIRKAAIAKITDQSILIEIAKNADENTLFDVVYNPNFTDQALLSEIVKTKKDYSLRSSAIKKIIDQKILADIAINIDHKNLADIASNNVEFIIRQAAIAKITDHAILIEIAKKANENTLYDVVNNPNFTDQTLLSEIVKTKENYSLRLIAIKKVNDYKLLIEIVNNISEYGGVRSAAISSPYFVNQALFEQIAISDKDYLVRGAAVKKITNHEILAQIAKNDKKKEVRSEAIMNNNLTDSTLFIEIAKNDKAAEVRDAALKRLQTSM